MKFRNLLIVSTISITTLLTANSFAQDLPSPESLNAPEKVEEKKEVPVEEVKETPKEEKVESLPLLPEAKDEDASTSAVLTQENQEAEDSFSKRKTDDRYVDPKMNLEGSLGLQHLAFAWGGDANTYNVGLLVEFFSGSNAIRLNDSNTLFAGNLLIQGNFTEWLSVNLRLGTRNNVNSFGRPQAMLSQGDAILGIKGSYEISEGFYLGGDLSAELPTDFGTAGIGFNGMSVRPRLLASLDFAEMTASDFQMHGHFNLGYRVDNSENLIPENYQVSRVERFAYNLSAYDMIEMKLGLAYDLPYITPFVTWNLDIPANGADEICSADTLKCVGDIGFSAYPNVISLGAKTQFWDRFGVHAGVDFGLTSEDANGLPVTAPYSLVGGFSWTIDPNPRIERVEVPVEVEAEAKEPVVEAPVQIALEGTLLDKETKKPIPMAIIKYPVGGETAQASNETGNFRTYGFAPGSAVKLVITHPDYEPVEFETRFTENENKEETGKFTVNMVPLPRLAMVSGLVENGKGDPIKGARIKITGPANYTAAATSAGKFTREIKAGEYSIAVSAPDYLSRGKDIKIEANSKTELQFVLKPKPKKVLVKLREDKIEIQQKIFFETGKANILPKSFGLLDQVVAVLTDNPNVKKIQIEGHTDDVGSDTTNLSLSQKRAESVRNYLVENGVGVGRLSAKGFGESRPILPNSSKRNRSLNRRVEFRIQK